MNQLFGFGFSGIGTAVTLHGISDCAQGHYKKGFLKLATGVASFYAVSLFPCNPITSILGANLGALWGVYENAILRQQLLEARQQIAANTLTFATSLLNGVNELGNNNRQRDQELIAVIRQQIAVAYRRGVEDGIRSISPAPAA